MDHFNPIQNENSPALPIGFLEKMEKLLDAEAFEQLLASYGEGRRYKGIRTNTLKCNSDEMRQLTPFETEPVPWCETGCYIDSEIRPGKNPVYYAGLYYVQEPTAMIPAEVLGVEPGDVVLDLCAAPGGKTTQLACKLAGQGLLIANELVVNRSAILAQNVERMGIPNCVILNAFPEHIAGVFAQSFDKILVDAPCSGEGMFRKEPAAIEGWSPENVERCAKRQQMILESVDKLLKPGGVLVYSTCTFSPEEDEQIVEMLLETGRYITEPIRLPGLTDHGRPEWTLHHTEAVADTLRVMPYKVKGEGHFIARLRKTENATEIEKKTLKKSKEAGLKPLNKNESKLFFEFANTCLKEVDFIAEKGKNLYTFGEKVYAIPAGITLAQLNSLKVLRPGLHLGNLLKNRFEPAHTLAMALKADQFNRIYNVRDDDEANTYLKGEPLNVPIEKGWTLVCYHNHPLGFGKSDGNMIKNHYPKGLRIRKK